MQKESGLDFSPLPDEAAMAQLAYTQWERAEAESMAEYVIATNDAQMELI